MKQSAHGSDSLQCSFCHKSQDTVGKLISSADPYPHAYICDECIAVCYTILEDDRAEGEPAESAPQGTPHPLQADPRVSDLLWAIEQWLRAESLGQDPAGALGEVRARAKQLCGS
ncbi:MAG TPA: ClpX C4-type zinc finger protein [Bryobacteraceae bacterium]|jgi:ATP-dependent Clp protease ATP-binding subunit ClpX|nr:ClpX C4-type zinc finger protein [Bryobacteraceae bacterium]